jgi:hypothetical protein
MKLIAVFFHSLRSLGGPLLLVCLAVGCATTPKVNWAERVGVYTFDQAVTELGPPEKAATLTDGTSVNEWLIYRGQTHGYVHGSRGSLLQRYNETPAPDLFLRLTFDAAGKLKEWKEVLK